MKTVTAICGALFIAALFCVMPAMATSQTVSVVQANPLTPMFSMSIGTGNVQLPLVLGTNTATGPSITIGGNSNFQLSAKDSMGPGTKPPASAGKLFQFKFVESTPTWASGSFGLTNALQTGVTGGSLTSLTAADQIIKTGNAESFTGQILFSQLIVVTDPASIPDQTWSYTENVMYTGSSV